MSNAYSTLINWLDSTGITGYFHDLSWSAIALIAICIALGLYIKFKKKKPKVFKTIEVSKGFYYYFHFVVIAIGICLAIQNAAYGYSLGDTIFSMILTAVLFFLADMAFAGGCYLYLPFRAALCLGVISVLGLFCLSAFAAFAWMAGQMHTKDNLPLQLKIQESANLNTQAAELKPHQYVNKRETNKAIKKVNDEIVAMSDKQGGYVSSGSAVYKTLADETPYSVNQLSISTKTLWSIALVMFVTSGGGILNHLRIRGDSTEKPTKPKDLVKQGAQGVDDEAATSKYYSRALGLIKNKGVGETIGITSLRKKISTNKTVQNEIIKRLIDDGEMDIDTSKAVAKYTRLKPVASKITNIFGWKKKG